MARTKGKVRGKGRPKPRPGGGGSGGGKKKKKSGSDLQHLREFGEQHPAFDEDASLFGRPETTKTDRRAKFREHETVLSKGKKRREEKHKKWAEKAEERSGASAKRKPVQVLADPDFARLDSGANNSAKRTKLDGSDGAASEAETEADEEEADTQSDDEEELDVAEAAPKAFDELVGLLRTRGRDVVGEEDEDDDEGWEGAGVDEGDSDEEDEMMTAEEAALRAQELGEEFELVAVDEEEEEGDAQDEGTMREEGDEDEEEGDEEADEEVGEEGSEDEEAAESDASADGAAAANGDGAAALPEAPPESNMGWTRRFDAHFDPASCREGVSPVWRKACETPLPREKPVDPLAADAQAQVAASPLENTAVYLAGAVISEAEPAAQPAAQATARRGRRKSAASADQGFSERLHKRLLLHQLPDTLAAANAQPADRASYLPPAARATFEYLDTYRDMYATQWDWERSEHYRLGYVLHGANHALRARDQVLRNTRALAKAAVAGRDLERRDQSFRPARVVFVVPFRHQALKIVGLLEALLVDKARDRKLAHLKHKKKFSREYSAEALPKPHPNAEYRRYFEGNLDDCFALGIRLRRHSVHLYADLHQCDIIVASPLGLRRLIGAEGDSERDFDFLNGVEVAIVDQADVMQMQNLEHLKDALAIMNAMPRETGEADILRMRHWALEGLGRHFRQTAILSAFATPELNALALRGCHNLAGRYRLCRVEEPGSVRRILRQVPQIFRRLEADSPAAAPDAHFEYFCEHVLPTLTGRSTRSHVLVVIPSYFDFVRVRNHLKRQQLIFAQICEYTTLSNVSRARTYFYHGERRFMLYTERFHFHNRSRLRSVKHIVFYQPPVYPQLYAELVNSLSAEPGEEMTVTVAFTRYDALRLTRIVGDERATRILSSERDTHMFL